MNLSFRCRASSRIQALGSCCYRHGRSWTDAAIARWKRVSCKKRPDEKVGWASCVGKDFYVFSFQHGSFLHIFSKKKTL
jgi:hypothetical protein